MSTGTDPRVGSSRDNNTSPGLSRLISGSNSSSVSTLLATLIPALVYAAICLILFVLLRNRCPRVYRPRTFVGSLPDHERTPAQPKGLFRWLKSFSQIPDDYILNHISVDGFLFLRYLKILLSIYAVGCCLLLPILLPLHATGKGHDTELDALTFGNIVQKSRYYAHAVLAWIFFGFVLYMIVRECVYCVNLRHAYFLSPVHANRLSSRTVLYTCVPPMYLNENCMKQVFGPCARRIWLPRYSSDLNDLVKEQSQTALRLEKAEINLIKVANTARIEVSSGRMQAPAPHLDPKMKVVTVEKTNSSDRSTESESLDEPQLPDVPGSVAAQWIPHRLRPTHRPIANYGRQVDTIKWTRTRLKKLRFRIRKSRRELVQGNKEHVAAVFVEYGSQSEAQAAYQALTHHQPLHMTERYIGVRPFEIMWGALLLPWWSRMSRKFAMQVFITVMIIFWAIPCAIVGTISNVKTLGAKISFLHWLLSLPTPLLGLIEGLLPAVALSLLMAIVPGIMRFCARIAGTPTLTRIEYYSQGAYFAFQVVQVFLVTTLSSAVSASLTQILDKPLSATSLLSKNLPKASNFYISYILVQCLGLGATALLQPLVLLTFHAFGRSMKDPRRAYTRHHKLRQIHWGGIFPVHANLGVITLSYALIAPIIIAFSFVGTCFVYVIYRHNILYVYDSEIDTRGLVYPRALSHLLTGLYFAEGCMIGLFALKYAAGPIILMAMLLGFTILVHITLLDAIGPLLHNIPRSLYDDVPIDEKDDATQSNVDPEDLIGNTDARHGQQNSRATVAHTESSDEEDPDEVQMDEGTARSVEGLPSIIKVFGKGAQTITMTKLKKEMSTVSVPEQISSPIKATLSWLNPKEDFHIPAAITPSTDLPKLSHKPDFIQKFLHPQIYASHAYFRDHVLDMETLQRQAQLESEHSPAEDIDDRFLYFPPGFYAKPGALIIPRDPGGVWEQERRHCEKLGVETSGEGAWLEIAESKKEQRKQRKKNKNDKNSNPEAGVISTRDEEYGEHKPAPEPVAQISPVKRSFSAESPPQLGDFVWQAPLQKSCHAQTTEAIIPDKNSASTTTAVATTDTISSPTLDTISSATTSANDYPSPYSHDHKDEHEHSHEHNVENVTTTSALHSATVVDNRGGDQNNMRYRRRPWQFPRASRKGVYMSVKLDLDNTVYLGAERELRRV